MFIATRDLTHTYMPGTPFATQALKGVNLTIERGSFCAVTGPSGSGKSTLVQHFNGLLRPTSGQVLLEGRPLGEGKDSLRRARRQVGLVFQLPEQQFFAETVFDEVAFAPRNLGLDPAEVEKAVEESLEQVGLDPKELRERSPFHLSAGQKRLVAIAAVLALKPQALVLDEPMAGLDPAGERNLFDLLRDLNRRRGLTVVVVTHRLEEIVSLVHRVYVLEEGSLIMEGSPEELFRRREELDRVGVAPPPWWELLRELAGKGYPVNTSALTREEACREIISLFKGEKR
ncbi:MAG TPA: energy-coupling factor transporter ATPase [Bacillota bacterium]|jgi:energy-coupling factor transport system ATP-binding protein|nr:energy-coupling factor transporter ATPase [Bacillota bacterium]HOB86573.1 energy-coupling factor transporter ATPase [Bacillota bacterium]HOP68318.1 energy-coupling factor transporter ATPase [Bacillota bacterium]HPT33985.1 energy-coupling factor transporter ATPase [Bacillota bacterium]HPZ64689.1 energy-coupling factor transporter ATPase [Bacillota bacterium]